MKQETKQLLSLIREYDKMRKVYLSCYEQLSVIRDALRASKYSLREMVNFIYVAREISRFADDLRKEADGIGHMFEKHDMRCLGVTERRKTGESVFSYGDT